MDAILDITDERQVELFNSLEELKSLEISRDINVPQLIVIGNQNSGKSSVLEALVRSHFPVSEKLCTRFPIKVILKDANEPRLKVSFEISDKSDAKKRARLDDFIATRKIDPTSDNLADIIYQAGIALGLDQSNSASPKHKSETQLAEDILVIEKHGEGLPFLSLVDLPGLWVVASREQDKQSKQMVEKMVETQALKPENLVLLVVTGKAGVMCEAAVAKYQELAEKDKGLSKRTIGVMTHPDVEHEHQKECVDVVLRKLGLEKLDFEWFVVKNLGKGQRKAQSTTANFLDDRDKREDEFFEKSAVWDPVAPGRKGVKSLRIALKEALWDRRTQSLPKIISKAKRREADIQARVDSDKRTEMTTQKRRDYLEKIAEDFSKLTKSAVDGQYKNERCKDEHLIGFPCRKCKGFFPQESRFEEVAYESGRDFDWLRNKSDKEDYEEGQNKKLLSNTRALGLQLAATMRQFGKTDIVSYSGKAVANSAEKVSNATDGDPVFGRYPSEDIVRKYYTYPAPKIVDHRKFEKMVAEVIERNRGHELITEVSAAACDEVFIGQSARWEIIGKNHVKAVLEVSGTFIDLALEYVCLDDKVRQALKTKIVDPSFMELEMKANRMLLNLTRCRSLGTGFFDHFHDELSLEAKVADLYGEPEDCGEQESPLPGKRAGQAVEVIKFVTPLLMSWASGGPSVDGRLKELMTQKIYDIINQAFAKSQQAATPTEESVCRKARELIPKELGNLRASRTVEIVEAYYRTAMIAFVGYVNSLVVQTHILDELPEGILCPQKVKNIEDDAVINEMTAEDKGAAEARERSRSQLGRLKDILAVLEAFNSEKIKNELSREMKEINSDIVDSYSNREGIEIDEVEGEEEEDKRDGYEEDNFLSGLPADDFDPEIEESGSEEGEQGLTDSRLCE